MDLTESTLFSVCCSLEQISNYWRESQFVYFEIVNFDSLHPVGFGILDTAAFGFVHFVGINI